ncbi:hypothetical protein [Butyrivibrio sp. AE3004]|uniref:hypothetical protein n=1 Tax=Butyrivibrio sp. AE3004 TaxID=1506994 RepID=UPI000494C246|nr:hypothetical protein [Butyrivibrio sp. AE3004]
MASIISQKQDLTFLKWSHIRNSSGTAGTFLKSESTLGGGKTYYKLSNFDPAKGVIGHECINEIIVDRLLTILGVEHLSYDLIYADIEIEGKIYTTHLCASKDFKKSGESKTALDNYYTVNANPGESHYDFCVRQGFKEYIDRMIAIDFIILNRDRHGANIEILRNSRKHTLRIAPLFDHGLSLIYSCMTDNDAIAFDVLADKPCQNFIGSKSCLENLELLRKQDYLFSGKLDITDKSYIFEGLDGVLSNVYIEKIWEMINKRYQIYEKL